MATQAQLDALARGRELRADPEYRKAKKDERANVSAVPDVEFVNELPPDDKAPKPRKESATPKKPVGRQPGYSPKGASLTKIHAGLVMMFTAAGMGVSMFDTYDGTVVATNAEKLADVWTQVAETNPRVRKVLETMLEGSAVGAALMTTAMVAVPILVHHGIAPENLNDMSKTMGVDVPPDATTAVPRGPVAVPTPPPVAGAATGGGTPVPQGQRDPDAGDVSYEDVTLPGYSGPPDRAA